MQRMLGKTLLKETVMTRDVVQELRQPASPPPDLACMVSNTGEWKGGFLRKAGSIRQTPSECGRE